MVDISLCMWLGAEINDWLLWPDIDKLLLAVVEQYGCPARWVEKVLVVGALEATPSMIYSLSSKRAPTL